MADQRPLSLCLAADDSDYMTVEEFAALTSDAHHAVWAAGGTVDTIQVGGNGGIRRYHRAQVRALLAAREP